MVNAYRNRTWRFASTDRKKNKRSDAEARKNWSKGWYNNNKSERKRTNLPSSKIPAWGEWIERQSLAPCSIFIRYESSSNSVLWSNADGAIIWLQMTANDVKRALMEKWRAHLTLISHVHATASRSNCQQTESHEIVLSFWCQSIYYHDWKNSRERERLRKQSFFSLFSSLARSRKDTLIDLFLSGKIKSILQGQLISGNRIGLIATISLMSDHFSASLSFPTQKVSPQSGNCSMNQRFTHLRGFIWITLNNEKMSIAILFAYEAISRLGEQLSLSCASR